MKKETKKDGNKTNNKQAEKSREKNLKTKTTTIIWFNNTAFKVKTDKIKYVLKTKTNIFLETFLY